jgi:hypothetical protein
MDFIGTPFPGAADERLAANVVVGREVAMKLDANI